MSTVTEKAARRTKAVPLEIDHEMWWCKEHRAWSGRLNEMTGRNGTAAMMMAEFIRRKPYDGFVPIDVWDNLPLESYTRPSGETNHWFPSQDREKVLLHVPEGTTVWRCGLLQDCGRWWPDKASAEACYDSHN
jgi:hypothetical protein